MSIAPCSVLRLPLVTIRLMTKRELARFFAEAQLVPERIGLLVKAWYVVFTGADW